MKTFQYSEAPYTALHACLEVYSGKEHGSPKTLRKEQTDKELGFRSVPFRSKYSLQLNYMQRRESNSLLPLLRHLRSKWSPAG